MTRAAFRSETGYGDAANRDDNRRMLCGDCSCVHAGRPRSALDIVVAAIGEANDCVVVTDNEKHFPGVNLLNPLRSA